MADRDCIFCGIAAGESPAEKLYEDEAVFAIMDIFPWNPGHVLVIPRTHAADIWEISAADAASVMKVAHRLAPAIRDAVGADGMNLLQSNGRAAWQAVDHFHLHLIPRWDGDRLVQPVSPGPGDKQAISETAATIRQRLS